MNPIQNNNKPQPPCVVVYHAGETISSPKDEAVYNNLFETFKTMIKDARSMPAFGVSLDNETRDAMKNGTWIEFVFDSTQSHNDMLFDSLLINVVPEHTGFNIVRKYQGKYEGRCFYLDIQGNMQPMYDEIVKLFD
jgi:hypothetical protein